MEPSTVSCFPRGLISLNTSVSYLIEPLPASMDTQQHAVFRAESLHLPGGSCLHHHGNKEHEEGLNGFIHGMMSPRSRRVSSDRTDSNHLPVILFFLKRLESSHIFCFKVFCLHFLGKKGPEPKYEVCGATDSGRQGRGKDTDVDVDIYGYFISRQKPLNVGVQDVSLCVKIIMS